MFSKCHVFSNDTLLRYCSSSWRVYAYNTDIRIRVWISVRWIKSRSDTSHSYGHCARGYHRQRKETPSCNDQGDIRTFCWSLCLSKKHGGAGVLRSGRRARVRSGARRASGCSRTVYEEFMNTRWYSRSPTRVYVTLFLAEGSTGQIPAPTVHIYSTLYYWRYKLRL